MHADQHFVAEKDGDQDKGDKDRKRDRHGDRRIRKAQGHKECENSQCSGADIDGEPAGVGDQRSDRRDQISFETEGSAGQDEGIGTRVMSGKAHEADEGEGEGAEHCRKDCLEKAQMKAHDDSAVYEAENADIGSTVEKEEAAWLVRAFFLWQKYCFFRIHRIFL